MHHRARKRESSERHLEAIFYLRTLTASIVDSVILAAYIPPHYTFVKVCGSMMESDIQEFFFSLANDARQNNIMILFFQLLRAHLFVVGIQRVSFKKCEF